MSSRSWCFTINNYTLDEELAMESVPCRYIIFGKEIGENNTPHLQGYMEFPGPVRMSGVKKIPGFSRAHIEPRRGTRDQAREYCKKDGEWLEFGNWEAGGQGARTDLKELMRVTREKLPTLEVMDEYPVLYARFQRFIEKYKALTEKEQTKKFRTVDVELIIGETGVGKSRRAREIDPDAFTVNPEDSFPFDGYDGESTIIIDDFEGQLKYKHLLKILDGHQLRINVKGSHRYAQWNKVIITTNEEPESWYQRGLTPPLKRRLKNVTRMCNEEAGNTMPPQNDNIEI